jgi:hypothetical protein
MVRSYLRRGPTPFIRLEGALNARSAILDCPFTEAFRDGAVLHALKYQ